MLGAYKRSAKTHELLRKAARRSATYTGTRYVQKQQLQVLSCNVTTENAPHTALHLDKTQRTMLSRSLKLALLCLAATADAFAAPGNVRRTTRLSAAADEFPRETARAAYSRFDDICADEECDARELAEDNGWDELRRLARREEAQDRAAAEKAAIAAFRLRLEERWSE